MILRLRVVLVFFFQAEDGIRDADVTRVQTCALPIFTQDTIPLRAIHNGLIVSPFGTFTDQVNGLSFSLWMSMGKKINGVSINLLWNFYEKMNGISIGLVNQTAETNGLQIGLVNKSLKLKGIQLGFWNKNEKRSLPIINWNFSRD